MKTIFKFLLVILPVIDGVKAQDTSAKPNAVYFELLGNGLIYSLNYERNIADTFYLRAGGMFLGFSDEGANSNTYRFYSFPLMLNKVISKRKKHLEIGVGLLYYSYNTEGSGERDTNYPGIVIGEKGIGLTCTVGYRHIFNNNVLFRVGVQPRYFFKTSSQGFAITPGISIGKVF